MEPLGQPRPLCLETRCRPARGVRAAQQCPRLWGVAASRVSSSQGSAPAFSALPEILEATQATFQYVSFLLKLAVDSADVQFRVFIHWLR